MTGQNPRALRDAFGSYMTGVTIVTALTEAGEPVGFTANSFTSVSLDPPLLLVCPAKSLSSLSTFAQCRHFAVNVLGAEQEAAANTFARKDADRFGKVSHVPDSRGVPLISGAIAQFSCTTETRTEAGDHLILIGRVDSFAHSSGAGLGYHAGRYFTLTENHIAA